MANADEGTKHSHLEGELDRVHQDIQGLTPSAKRRVFEKFLLAALGSIPWVGGFISTLATLKTEAGDIKADAMRTQWLAEHQRKLSLLTNTLDDIASRLETFGAQIDERIQSEAYLALVRQSFRTWDAADTEEKRRCVATLIANASATTMCSDDVVRLFIDWLHLYHEAHFAVIRTIHKEPGATRFDIWSEIHGDAVREDSAEADLFRLLIRDLSTGGLIRQSREATVDGRFLRKHPRRAGRRLSPTMESAFEDTKPYELTSLGRSFVHYAMSDAVPRIDGGGTPSE